jgi:hypothetical protein
MISMLAFGQSATQVQPADRTGVSAEPPMLGIHWAKGTIQDERLLAPRRSVNMTYHGGVIMPTANSTAIFWGPSWATSPGDKITGMDSWYQGFGGSNYAKTSDEYTGLQRPGYSVNQLRWTLRRYQHSYGRQQHQCDPGGSLQDDHEPRSVRQRLLSSVRGRATRQRRLLRLA